MARKKKSKAPTQAKITRSGDKFKFAWTRGDTYGDGQDLIWCYRTLAEALKKKFKWHRIKVSTTQSNTTVGVGFSKYYPNTTNRLYELWFGVRGNHDKKSGDNYGWSSYRYTRFRIYPPKAPTVTHERDEEAQYKGTFKWALTTSTTDNYPFTRAIYQTAYCETGTLPEYGSDVASTASGSFAYDDSDKEGIAVGSHRRYFKIKSQGPGGDSKEVEVYHTFASAALCEVDGDVYAEKRTGSLRIGFNFRETEDLTLHPVDLATPQFTFVTPEAGLACPSGASWTDSGVSVDKVGGVQFETDKAADADQCLFVRVNTQHDGVTTPGTPQIVRMDDITGYGTLTAPTITTLEVDTENLAASITAANNSEVPDSFIAVWYQPADGEKYCCGIITDTSSAATVKVTELASDYRFGLQAVQGEYTETATGTDGVSRYALTTVNMSSDIVWNNGEIPTVPTNVSATATGDTSAVITWDWNDADAAAAEISYSTSKDAWNSNETPSSVLVNTSHAPTINILQLTAGETYYFRVRFATGTTDDATRGPWSDITDAATVSLSSAPTTPSLTLSKSIITMDDTVTAAWAYASADGSAQGFAGIYEATITDSGITYGDAPIASATGAQTLVIDPVSAGWAEGETHYLAIRLTSAKGRTSGWSPAVSIDIAPAITAAITETSLVEETVTIDDETTETVNALKAMPLTVTITGAGDAGTTTLIIRRAKAFFTDRPDDSTFDGFEDESIAVMSQTGEAQITVNMSDLVGELDQNGEYYIEARVTDIYGQTAASDPLYFTVNWTHLPDIPTATVEIDADNLITKITPAAPDGAVDTDVCDIYRLSADQPVLIVQDAAYGTTYVDRYPAFRENGGHRIVAKTETNCYITADHRLAWLDLAEDDGDYIDEAAAVIDYNGGHIRLPWDVELDNQWEKQFERTEYLGGSQQGDWNPAVERKLDLSVILRIEEDADTIAQMRDLSVYPGICHVRTPDGSSFSADVEITETRSVNSPVAEFSINITQIDSEGLDGLTLDDWTSLYGG